MDLRDSIIRALVEIFEEDDLTLPEFHDGLVLLDTELDSLGFAVLVTRLDETLGFDPFSLNDEAVYPETLGEFIAIYQRFAPDGVA